MSANGIEFALPAELEAREPPEARGLRRDQVRLLVSHRADDRVVHARFTDLPAFLRPGDLLVANDSATLPAALTATRAAREVEGAPAGPRPDGGGGRTGDGPDGGEIALHLSTRLPDGHWVVEPRRTAVAAGQRLRLPGGGRATLLGPYRGSQRLWVARLDLGEPALDYLQRWGRPITYPYLRGAWPLAMYQTVYAAEPGSAEMPSAGRAFTPELLRRLEQAGVGFVTLTLHAGVSSLEEHEPPYPEPYAVPDRTAEAVEATRASRRRVIAVGTTVVRALESAADGAGRLVARRGWTDLVITPERGLRVVDGLLTGFHEPKASHLAMLEALAGRAHLDRVYRAAVEEGYLWHEFGDLHLLLP